MIGGTVPRRLFRSWQEGHGGGIIGHLNGEDSDMPQTWELPGFWTSDRVWALDQVAATSDGQIFDGTPGDELIRSDGHDDVTLNGHEGNDYLLANGGTGGVFNGGAGMDYVIGGDVSDITGTGELPQNTGGVFNGGDGDDVLSTGDGTGGTFNGGTGNDFFDAVMGGTFNGDAGDDVFWTYPSPGLDSRTYIFDGGAGSNMARIEARIGTLSFAKDGGMATITQGNDTIIVTNAEKFQFLNAEGTSWDEYSFQEIPCFLPGTLIATPSGEVPIETLKAGDLVLTSDGEARPVRWLARQTVSTVFANPLQVMPILIRAGALGEGLPARDLYVSPDHALFLDGLLVHAGALVNDSSIVRHTAMPERFTYYHVELDDHSLILAEGTPVETFIDNVTRQGFDNWQDAPEAPVAAELELPRIKAARQLSPHIHNWLAIRAKVLGYAEEAA